MAAAYPTPKRGGPTPLEGGLYPPREQTAAREEQAGSGPGTERIIATPGGQSAEMSVSLRGEREVVINTTLHVSGSSVGGEDSTFNLGYEYGNMHRWLSACSELHVVVCPSEKCTKTKAIDEKFESICARRDPRATGIHRVVLLWFSKYVR